MCNAFTFSGFNGGTEKVELKNAGRERRRKAVSRALPTVQSLEDRRLFSVGLSVGPTAVSVTPPVTVLRETTNAAFTADLGSFTYPAPGTSLSATVSWGDGTTSTGVIKSDGVVGIDEIKFEVDGSHTYTHAGDFPILATVFTPGVTSSGVDHVVTTLHDLAIVTAATTNTPLDGTVSGTYSILPPTTLGSGAEYLFSGTGTAGVLGPVSATGKVDLSASLNTSATATGLATGTLTLTSAGTATAAGGSVTLKLTATLPTKPGAFPSLFTYVITSGTGIYAHAAGTGTIAVTLGSSTVANSFEFVIKSSSTVPPPILPIIPVSLE